MDARDAPSRCSTRSAYHLSTQSKASVIILISLFSLTSFPLATVGGGATTQGSCSTPNGLCGPIIFDTAVKITNTTIQSTTSLTTPSWSATKNETSFVVASTFDIVPANVVSVTDTLGDSFTRLIQIQNPQGNNPTYDLEVWQGIIRSSGPNAVTANWNASNHYVLQAASYLNVKGVGNLTSFVPVITGSSLSMKLTTEKSGSWVMGVLGERSSDTAVCPPGLILTSPFFIRRSDACAFFTGPETEISDNATSLRNGFSLTFNPSISPPPEVLVGVEIELVASDLEPSVNTTVFCPSTGDTCHTNYAGRASGTQVATNIVVGTAYCTGVTTTALTTTTTQLIQEWAAYGAQSRNDTGAQILVQMYISTNAPAVVFGSGLCAAGGTIIGGMKITFDTSGTTLTAYGANEYFASTNGAISETAGTYYGWLEITPQSVGNVNTGVPNLGSTIQFGQFVTLTGTHSYVSLQQQK